jgi:tripartite-type tricarboxylate transporter receptor subunit TctC
MIHVRGAATLALAFAIAAAAPASAQEWPSGTVRVIVPYAAGGPLDFPARLLIDRLAAQTKGVFILEHRAGAGGAVGAQAVVQSAPDGSTLLFTSSSITAAPAIYPKLPFDPLQALIPISLVTEFPISIAVRANHPLRDLADLIAQAKAQPGKFTYGSGGVGTGNHLGGELLKKMAGIDLLHVPFRGISVALTALYAGDIDMVITNALESLAHARDGRVRVLAVGGAKRMPELPDTPAIGELVPGYVMTNWYGLFGPRGLPAHVLARLETEIPKVREDPSLTQRATGIGMTMILSPADVRRARMEAEVPRWKQLVPEIGLKTE